MVLKIENLTVKLPTGADREFAIEDVSLNVDKGEIVCVVGESGSGKSVTAFTIMGLIPRKELTPTAGKILLEGGKYTSRSNPHHPHNQSVQPSCQPSALTAFLPDSYTVLLRITCHIF